MTLHLSLMGAFQTRIGNQIWQTFPSQKAQALLVYLAMEHKAYHSRLSLSRLFWPDADENDARNCLRVSLYRLRRAIDKQSPHLSQTLLHVDRHTIYAIVKPDCIQVDALTFQNSLDAVANHPHSSLANCSTCLQRLDETLQNYHGDFLAGQLSGITHAFDEWILTQRERLHEQALHGYTQLLDVMARQHKVEKVITLAQRQLMLEPWHEAAHRHLMRSFAYAGRRAEALAQYAVCKDILRTEFDIAPAAQTERLYAQILQDSKEQTAVSTPPPPSALPQKPTFTYTPHNLPEPLTPLVGRHAERQQLRTLLTQPNHRLVTIIGAGGIGKTTLAHAVAREQLSNFPGGVWHVSLEGLQAGNRHETAAEILLSIATTLGIEVKAKRPFLPQIISKLQNKTCLLVCDNFEPLVSGSAVLNNLLQRLPQLRILCTSREPLYLQAEWLLPLRGLAVPPYGSNKGNTVTTYASSQLFALRARQYEPTFAITEQNAAHVATICRLLHGSPLGIELAASWVHQRTLTNIIGAMRHSLDFLCSQRRDLPARQRTLRMVFDGSWALLTSDEQRIVAALSIFRGHFSPTAALKVAEATVLQLKTLHEKSILQLENGLYYLSDLWRQYAAERLDQLSNRQVVKTKHGRYMLHWLTNVATASSSNKAIPQLHALLDDIDQAWHWAQTQEELEALTAVLPALIHFYTLADQQATINGRLHHAIAKWQHHPSSAAQQFVAQLQQATDTLEPTREEKTAVLPVLSLPYQGKISLTGLGVFSHALCP